MATLDDLVSATQELKDDVSQLISDVNTLLSSVGQLNPADQKKLDSAVQSVRASIAAVQAEESTFNSPAAA